ncbi:mechanosensitive ion channel family protein [Vallicoccus soli]|uniref:Mechanosensitive ion channel family protein n=1 Tax=Vallicoccus soli TaxID=2339232 RepID=A0A3A3ZLK6_9ACTN|nr:mechanosensitive ion channel family protein [Vallicoccus soli]RJK97126.1 mechanosensitive ion channel family protein [Vallicoccus soli]
MPSPLAAPAPAATPGAAVPAPTPTPSGAATPSLEDLVARLTGDDQEATPGLACWQDPAQAESLCRRVYDVTGSEWLARSSDWVVAKPATVLFVLLVAVVLRRLLHRLITRLAARVGEGTVPGALQRGKARELLYDSPLVSERRKQRAETMGSVLRSVTTGVVFSIAGLMVLAELGLDIAPLLASAGILGVALGFGAQTLVKDFLSGMFMILEDQYGVGDVVDLGEASGSVEAVGLRITRLRSVDGTVWYVRNGEVLRVGNMSQGWARAVLDMQVAPGTDVAKVRSIMQAEAHALAEDPAFAELVLEEPEVWGVEATTADALVVRAVVKTVPLKQWDVARELRQRITAAFDREGVPFPFQRMMWTGAQGPGAEGAGAQPRDAAG